MADTAPTSPEKKPRVKKADWLRTAFDLLEEGGIEAVRVERLAARLGVAKSGFYYHFKNHDTLCDELLGHWLEIDATPILRDREMKELPAELRLLKIAELIDRQNLVRYDLSIRLWARQSPKVRRTWRKEVARRVDYIRALFAEIGFEGDDLEARTRLFVAYQMTGAQVFDDLTRAERDRLRDRRVALLTRRP